MTETKKLLSGGALLLVGHGMGQILGFVRNFIVARLVVPEDFGVAATFAATLSVLEAAAEFGWDKLIIQSKDGENPSLMATVHGLTVVRGIFTALVLFLAAGPISHAFDVPEARSAFQWLALVPLLRGFMHMDIKRLQRVLKFAPEVWVSISSQTIGLIAAASLAWLIADYRAMLWALVLQSAVLTVVSHMLAERRYAIGFQFERVKQVFLFGWPLLLNGLVIVATAQGDRLLIGAELGVKDLALYAAAALLINAPGLLMTRVAGSIALPWLSAVQDQSENIKERHGLFGASMAGISIVVFVPMMLLGTEFVARIFGEAYRAPDLLMGFLALGFALRFMRGWPIATSLALGDTKNVLITNAVRPVGLIAAIAVLAMGGNIIDVAAALIIGEALGLLVAIVRLARVSGVSILSEIGPLVVAISLPVALLSWMMFAGSTGFLNLFGYAVAAVFVGLIAVVLFSPSFSILIKKQLNRAANP